MGLTRSENWELILAEEIKKAKQLNFSYGENDCTIWSINVIKQYTNLSWSPTWSNRREALIAMKELNMYDEITSALGYTPHRSLCETKRGDLVKKNTGLRSTLGICIGSNVVFRTKPKGICFHKLNVCENSWRI